MQEKASIPNHLGNQKSQALYQTSTDLFFSPVVQPKLIINQPDDEYEKADDAAADTIIRMKNEATALQFFKPSLLSVQRKCTHCREEETLNIGSREIHTVPLTDWSPHNYVGNLSGGKPLSRQEQQFFGTHFKYDFSNVRLHTDLAAAKSAQSINARAYASGNNIVFNSDQYSPQTNQGKRLLGHELAHVIQQSNGGLSNAIQRDEITVKVTGDPHFYDRSLRGNRYYEHHSKIPGWPYLEQLRTLWQAHSYDDFADAVRNYQENVMRLTEGDGILGPKTATAISATVDEPGQTASAPTVTAVTLETLRQSNDWIERRIKGVGIPGWGGPFRLDLELNNQGFPMKSIFLPRSAAWLGADPFAGHTELQISTQIFDSAASAQEAVKIFPFARPDATLYAFYRGEENIIFPTIISETTTPYLIQALQAAISQEADEAAKASNVLVESLLLAIGAKAPIIPEAAIAPGAASSPEPVSVLRYFFSRLLKTGSADVITVGGVEFGNVVAATEAGNVLRITYGTIRKVNQVAGQGKVMSGAFEEAAVALGRESGASVVKVSVKTVANPKWRADLQKMGYVLEWVPQTTKTGTNLWTKFFKL